MKHLLTAISIFTLLSSQSCNSGKAETAKEYKRVKADTALTFALVMANIDQEIVQSIHLMRIIKDTFTVDKVDTVGDKLIGSRKWRIDTLYYYPALDTIKLKSGKDSVYGYYRLMPSRLVIQDFNKQYKTK